MKNIYVALVIFSFVIVNLFFSPAMAMGQSELVCKDITPIFSQFRKLHYKFHSLNKEETVGHAQAHIQKRAFFKELNDDARRALAAPFLAELTRILSSNIFTQNAAPSTIASVCDDFQKHILSIKDTQHPLAQVQESRILQQYLSYFFLSIDPFSNFVSFDNTLASLQPYSSGYPKGIGITVDNLDEEKDYQLMVTNIVKNGPADKARIMRGDVLLKINDTDLRGCDWNCYNDIIDLPENVDQFWITVLQSGKTKLSTEVTRHRMSPQDYNLVSENPFDVQVDDGPARIGYLSLKSFYNGSGMDMHRRLKELEKTTDALVLNLQKNAGGNTKDMLEVISSFTNQGGVVGRSVFLDGRYSDFIAPLNMANTYTKPLVILVSNRTKSAGEFTAGVLQSLNRAVVIGLNGDQKTYGKGSTFTWFLVYKGSDGSIKYTDVNHYDESSLLGALYVTSNVSYLTTGKSTHFTGITPDIVFPAAESDPVYKENLLWLHHTESENENTMGPQITNTAFDSPGNDYDPNLKEKIKYLASSEETKKFVGGHLEQQIAFSRVIAARLTNKYLKQLASASSDPMRYSGAM